MVKILTLAMTILLISEAQAAETAESYYARQMKSCEITVRESWRDYLLYTSHKRLDECCAASVRSMAKIGAKLADNRQCPPGYQPNMLKCTSSKQWCEPAK